MSSKDRLFSSEQPHIPPFKFDERVANAFDDMIERSVPFYQDLQTMILRLAQANTAPQNHIIDLGCSTGTSLANIVRAMPDTPLTLTGIDNSPPMLEKAKQRLSQLNPSHTIQWITHDLNTPIELPPHHMALLVLTLQFISPSQRPSLLQNIYTNLAPQGSLILVEKLQSSDPKIEDLFTTFYYGFKKDQHYSELEIAQKRQALDKVLQPLRLEENQKLLKHAGFRRQDIFFKWCNFVGILAIK